MHPRFTSISFLILLISVLFLHSCSEKKTETQQPEEAGRSLQYTGEVTFLKAEGDTISTIKAAIADDNQTRTEGLMNVMDLPNDAGMLFIFPNEQPRSFWMANTPLPLDILFVDAQLNIVRIHRNTQPYSQESIQSDSAARFVVEVNAGYTLDHDIREGMKIGIEGVDY